ncbi:TPA: hypothetical protein ACH3X3_006217 [Trebouxia sp. C0006]
MPHFRCQPISSQNQQCGLHRPAGLSGQAWARYLQAGSAANLHKLRHSLPKRVRQSQHSFVLFASAAPAQTASRRPKATANTDSELLDCVIVGAGISGLTLAQAFASEHSGTVAKVIITEAQDRVGGNITTKKADGFQYETGPNSFQPSDPVLKLAVDVGIANDIQYGNPTAPRFVFWEKKLRPTPSGPDVLTFDLLSIGGKLRAGMGLLGLRPKMPDQEESVEQYVRRNLGKEVFERLIEPFCSGVYAGDPSKLSMQAAFGKIVALEKSGGTILGGAIKLIRDKKKNPGPPRDPSLPPKPKGQTVGSFTGGLRMLPEAIAHKMHNKLRTSWKLQSVSRNKDNTFALVYDTPDGQKQLKTKSVALTVPAYTAADLLQDHCTAAADKLRGFDYPPVGAVTLAYPMSSIRDDRKDKQGEVPGFGQLHPRSQGITTLGTIYSSSVFENRAPKGQHLVLNFIGGATNRGIVDQPHEELVSQVDKDLRVMLVKPDAPAPKTIDVTVWRRAIPQFNIHHLDDVQELKEDLVKQGWSGFYLGGNYVSGVALGKCVEYGYTMAKEVARYLESDGAAGYIAGPQKTQDEAFYQAEIPITNGSGNQ